MFLRRSLLPLSIVVAVSLSSMPQARASDRLDTAMTFWEARLPFCEGFLSKEFDEPKTREDGTTYFLPCNDGDTILFSGLTCSVGDKRGCDTVKRSQGTDGRWWRSPRKLREGAADGGSETTFSNDHAAGVWAYIAEERDTEAFRKWTRWIKRNDKLLGFIPKYCEDSRCGFKFMDCPMLDRLAVVLNVANPVCDEAPLPPLPIILPSPTKTIHEIRNALNDVENAIKNLPVAGEIIKYEPSKILVEKQLAEMEKLSTRLEDLRSRIMVLARVSADTTGIIGRLNAIVNDPGFSRHNIAVNAYLLQKYTATASPLTLDAVRKVAAIEPKNAFINFVAYGPSPEMVGLILDKCRTEDPKEVRPRFQWIWERADNDKSDPPRDTMYWDCLFTAKLYKGGPVQKVSLPELPGMIELYKAEQAAFDGAEARAEEGIAAIKAMIKKPTVGNVIDAATTLNEIPAAAAAGAAASGAATVVGGVVGGVAGNKAGQQAGQTAATITKTVVNPGPTVRRTVRRVCRRC
ncbi:hypothetical protein ACVI1J_006735 [Bradyrhizobium diazoefficiens]